MNCMFTLDSYEQYETVLVRPLPRAQDEPGSGRFTYVEAAWDELEPSRGAFALAGMKAAIRAATRPVLVLRPVPPAWAAADPAGCFAAFVRKVGSAVDADGLLEGVVITTTADRPEEWNAYMDAFEAVPLLADLHHAGMIRHLRERGRAFGLLVACSEANWIECCEAFARQQLQRVWRHSPVVLHVEDPSAGPAVTREALRWHAGLSNVDMGLGSRLALRRMTYAAAAASGGCLPLRLWFDESGSARRYRELALRLRLSRDGVAYEIPLHADTQAWLTGDLVHNEMLQLPEATPGDYAVALGAFAGDGSPVRLSIEGQGDDGYYEAGMLRIEGPGLDPHLGIWDTYYPEGYYPLEDPKLPDPQS